MWLLDKMLRKLIKKGELVVTNYDGKEYRYGAPDPNHGPVHARLTDKGAALERRLFDRLSLVQVRIVDGNRG